MEISGIFTTAPAADRCQAEMASFALLDQLRIPYQRGDLIDLLQREAAVLNMEYAEDCTVVEAVVKPEIWGRVKDFAAPAGEDTP